MAHGEAQHHHHRTLLRSQQGQQQRANRRRRSQVSRQKLPTGTESSGTAELPVGWCIALPGKPPAATAAAQKALQVWAAIGQPTRSPPPHWQPHTWQASSSACLSSGREEVSVITTGTPSGVVSAGSLAGGSTGGGWSGKVSVAAAVMRLVLPTPSSPTTHMCTVLGAPRLAIASDIASARLQWQEGRGLQGSMGQAVTVALRRRRRRRHATYRGLQLSSRRLLRCPALLHAHPTSWLRWLCRRRLLGALSAAVCSKPALEERHFAAMKWCKRIQCCTSQIAPESASLG